MREKNIKLNTNKPKKEGNKKVRKACMKRSDEHEYAQYSRIRSDVSKVELNEKEK